MKPKILVTGSNGQLATEIYNISQSYNKYQFIFKSSADLDITNEALLNDFFSQNKISYIINCAAYTQVDKAEIEKDKAFEVNELAVKYLVNIAEELGIVLIHISTDYVFNGQGYLPLNELDKTNPIGVYGASKRAGELHIIKSNLNYIIIRTSWLYSKNGHNFLNTIKRIANDNKSISVISDQIGTPTYAGDLAKVILEILPKINKQTTSVYHYSNEGVASWYDFAYQILKLSNIKCELKPIRTADYHTKAERPYYSVLDKKKIKEVFNVNIPYWVSSLKTCLES